MRKIMFASMLVLLTVLLVAIPALAGVRVILCHKENGQGSVEMWLSVNENAVPAHIGHGDVLWPEVTVCGGVEIPYIPDPEVTAQPAITEQPVPVVTEPVPTDEPMPNPPLLVKIQLYLPLVRNECVGWPYCIVPR